MKRKLKRRFILTGLSAIIILLLLIDLGFRFLSLRQLNRSLDLTISYIIDHNGTSGMAETETQSFDETEEAGNGSDGGTVMTKPAEEDSPGYTEVSSDKDSLLEKLVRDVRNFGDSVTGNIEFTTESRFRARYFLVTLDPEGNIVQSSLSHIAAVDQDTAESMAEQHYQLEKSHGLLKYGRYSFYYKIVPKEDGTVTAGFLECTQEVEGQNAMRGITLLISFSVAILFSIILACLSERAIRPYLENMESQKQFITNAGHELKTPLAIISANTEVIEMMDGESEWTDSIKEQVKRSTGLINSMLALARMNETQKVELTEVNLSELAEASARSFDPVISQQKKKLKTEIAENVTTTGDRNLLTELCNILIDNASKYCDDGGTVSVSVKKKGRNGALLLVSNDYKEGKGEDYSKFFRRFYRGDTSHSSKTSGHGIGLSMAQSIVGKMNGTIAVSWKDGVITFTVNL